MLNAEEEFCLVVSWPINYKIEGIDNWLIKASKIIYIGCNTDGTMCGDIVLWKYLTSIDLIDHLLFRDNTALAYINRKVNRHLPHHEEYAGLQNNNGGLVLSYSNEFVHR